MVLSWWAWMASLIFLLTLCCSVWRRVASQSMSCICLLYMDSKGVSYCCWISWQLSYAHSYLWFNDFPVSPMCTSSHWQGIWYITPGLWGGHRLVFYLMCRMHREGKSKKPCSSRQHHAWTWTREWTWMPYGMTLLILRINTLPLNIHPIHPSYYLSLWCTQHTSSHVTPSLFILVSVSPHYCWWRLPGQRSLPILTDLFSLITLCPIRTNTYP